MKEFTFAKKSWHYKLAKLTNSYESQWGHNLCSYMTRVTLGLLLFVVYSFGASVFAAIISIELIIPLAMAIYEDISHLFGLHHVYITFLQRAIEIGNVVLSVFGVAAVILGIVAAVSKWIDREDSNDDIKVEKPHTFVGLAYKSWKEKVCYKVNFK